MTRPSLHDRILAALRLQPMTIHEMALALSVLPSSAWRSINELRESGEVSRIRTMRHGNGRPWDVWGLA